MAKDGGSHATMPDVARRFMRSSRAGTLMADLANLYAPHVVSVHGPAEGGRIEGIDALARRMAERQAGVAGDPIHADGPYLLSEDGAPIRFAILFEREWRGPDAGPLERMSQLAVFAVEGDRIVREEVFLQPVPAGRPARLEEA